MSGPTPKHPLEQARARRGLASLLMGCGLALAACDTVAEGKNELVAFAFDADSALIPAAFSTHVAKGLKVGVRVYRSESDKTAVSVIEASSATPGIAEVRSTVGNLITLEAQAAGTAEIAVTVADGEDAFDVTVDDLAKADLNYPGRLLVPDSPTPLGLQGGTARFIMTLKNAANNNLIGYGDVPVEVAPTGAATTTASAVGYLDVTFNVPGSLTITGQGDEALTMEVVAQADLTALEWTGLDIANLPAGEKSVAILRGVVADGDKVVGVASVATVTTNDASVCTVTPSPSLGEGLFTIEAIAAGECQVSATLGALADRQTLTIQ
ncbi:MAG: hypothetical protein IT385_07130 [Deltaproteobacteria bacterium]|nr:hypothetical protein [Deltaproteobacteria bacterium]